MNNVMQVLALERYLAITKPIEYHNAIQERKKLWDSEPTKNLVLFRSWHEQERMSI